MDLALWAIQIILSIKLITVSYTHGLRQSQPTMQEAIQKLGKFSQPLLYIISVCTFIGAGIIGLASVLGSSTWLIPITAVIMSHHAVVLNFLPYQRLVKNPRFLSVLFFWCSRYLSLMGDGYFFPLDACAVEIYMLTISATDEWRTAHPGAIIGLLELSGVENTHSSPQLDERKRETEARLRESYKGFTRQDFLSLPVMSAYERYYKQFDKTYHVQLQLESIVLKGKSLPDVSPLVDSNFIAEVETLVLTAGHDVAKLCGSILMDVSREGDHFTQMNGDCQSHPCGRHDHERCERHMLFNYLWAG